MMGAFYFALTDENGVLCVDQMDSSHANWTAEQVAQIAQRNPEVIYFHYWAGTR